ncbi:hypothetical protein AB6D20_027875 (plasmid) [Vibrio splendidus]
MTIITNYYDNVDWVNVDWVKSAQKSAQKNIPSTAKYPFNGEGEARGKLDVGDYMWGITARGKGVMRGARV